MRICKTLGEDSFREGFVRFWERIHETLGEDS